MSRSLISTCLRGLLGLVFLLAAMSKLTDPQEFLSALAAYRLPLPPAILPWIAASVPWFELSLAALLLTRTWADTTPLMTAAICLGFAALTAQAWLRGLSIDCGCLNLGFLKPWLGDTAIHALGTPAIATARNLLLALLSVILVRMQPASPPCPLDLSEPKPQPS